MIKIYKYGEVGNSEIFARENIDAGVGDAVREIIDNVAKRGDAALREYSRKFDGSDPESLEIGADEIDSAYASLDLKLIEVMREAADNIREFHSAQVRQSFVINERDGVVIGQKIMPIERRTRSSSFRGSAVRSLPSTITEPEVGRSSRLMQRTSVDFPAPERPMMPKVSPSSIVREMSCTAWICPSPSPKSLVTF